MGAIQSSVNQILGAAGHGIEKAYKKFVNNPNITKLQQQTNTAVQNNLWKERMSNYKQSLSDRANTLVEQKNNMKDLVLSIGGKKVDANIGNLLDLNPQLKENK